MIRTVFFFMVLLAGCSVIRQTETPIEPPELVKSTPLPRIPMVVAGGEMKFNVRILVLKDGTVGNVKLLESSGIRSGIPLPSARS